MEISVLIDEFAAHLTEDPDTSSRTAEFYEADLKEFARFLAQKNVVHVEDVGMGSVMDFRSHLAPRARRLSKETVETLERYLDRRTDETPELIIGRAARPVSTSKSLQNALWKRCDQVGLPGISPMVLRHTFAVKLLRRGATLNELKEALGVRDTTNIGVYKKFV